MSDFSKVLGAIALAPALHELNKGKGTNADEFKALQTEKATIEEWWNSLSWEQKVEVGSAGLHFGKMSPRYPWKCQLTDMYSDLTKSQKKIVQFVWDKRNEKYSVFYLPALLKL